MSVCVAIDTSYFQIGKGGVARYIECLLAAIRKIAPSDIAVQTISFPLQNHEFRQPQRMLKTLAREVVWQPILAPLEMRRMGIELLHATSTACVRAPQGVPVIATLHDLAYLLTPERFRRWTRLRIPIELAAYRRADYLICPSQATANDAIRYLGVPARRIHVIHHGSTFDGSSLERAPGEAIPERFFLFVSSIESGKNLRLLNEVYHQAEARGRSLPPLLIVGRRVEGVAHEGKAPASWRYLGRLDDPELVWLYRRALALVYPSKFEGFGFPVLEAMALGTAVICSPVSSLPEVGGDVPIYADQTPESYGAALEHLLDSPAERADRIRAGRTRANAFSWYHCAGQTLDLYRSIAMKTAR